MSRRIQKVVVLLIALALILPVGAAGIFQLFSPSAATPAQQAENRVQERVDPASQPKPSPTTPPAAPEKLGEDSEAGAEQTARYLLASYPYMNATGDIAPWQAHTADDCQPCQALIGNTVLLHKQGGYQVDGKFNVNDAAATRKKDGTVLVTLAYTSDPAVIVEEPTLPARREEGTTGSVDITLRWDGKAWRAIAMSLGE
ncbi:hypothetical protein KRX56_01145 [Dermabacteraceae bacterium TAE3-ERU27]|nr:hypothetical protein [Dermabacteraceae bacterium TAE3-ERU27]